MCACARTASPKHIQTLQVEISADLDLDLVEAGPKYPNMSKRGRTRRAVEGSPDSQAAICRNNVHLMLDFRVKLLQSVLLNSFTMSHVFPCFSWCFIFFIPVVSMFFSFHLVFFVLPRVSSQLLEVCQHGLITSAKSVWQSFEIRTMVIYNHLLSIDRSIVLLCIGCRIITGVK